MFKVLNTKEKIYGIWIEGVGWMQNASGTPTIWGFEQGTNMCFKPNMKLKELFLCCKEDEEPDFSQYR